MPNPTQDLHLDFETYSDLDLKKVGVYRYVEHPSFRVLCVAWKIAGRTTQGSYSTHLMTMPDVLVHLLQNPDVQAHAWNAAFETAVLKRLNITPAHPLSCTMQRALAYGLPAKLEAAALALARPCAKDMAGHKLMMRMSRPPKAPKPGAVWGGWTDADYQALTQYCIRDVEAEESLSDVIPQLMPDEQELSQLDAAMNTGGELGIDLNRVSILGTVAEAAEKLDAKRCTVLTAGAVTSPGTQTARLLKWLHGEGVMIPDTQRATIEEELLTCAAPVAREVLQIRLRTARASNNKLQRMLDMSSVAGRALEGQFQFVGAGRTGRWSGRGVQVQNLPRIPKGFHPDDFLRLATSTVIRGDLGALDAVAPAPVLDCVSWSLRSCLKATGEALVLWSFDFSQIEARVLAWLAGQQDILAVFAAGDDVYTWAAAQFGSQDRQLGKVLVLALGFGMGAIKLRDTARKSYGVELSPHQAEGFKTMWRKANDKIVRFWYEMENAAREAILCRGVGYVAAVGGSGIAFTCTGKTLQMRLPSGRLLYYHGPRLDLNTGSIVYWGTEVGGRWIEQRTWGGKLAENATQAAARDIMSEAMLRVWRRERRVPCMTVHDELVYTIDRAAHGWSHMMALMLEAPPWAGGLPLAGEHKIMRRYGVAGSYLAIANAP